MASVVRHDSREERVSLLAEAEGWDRSTSRSQRVALSVCRYGAVVASGVAIMLVTAGALLLVASASTSVSRHPYGSALGAARPMVPTALPFPRPESGGGVGGVKADGGLAVTREVEGGGGGGGGGFRPLFDSVPGVATGVAADAGPVKSAQEHLAVVSAYWEVNDARWRSKKRTKNEAYYVKGLTNLARIVGRSRHSLVVYTAVEANTCQDLEAAYKVGLAQSRRALQNEGDGLPLTPVEALPEDRTPRFLCLKLPLQNLHYGKWHLAEHSLVENMPCASSMKATKMIWLNKINLAESAAHLLRLGGGAIATRIEWIDADQFAEITDGPHKVLSHVSPWNDLPEWAAQEQERFKTPQKAALGANTTAAPVEDPGEVKGDGPLKPQPGFKLIKGLVYSWDTRKQLPEDELESWQRHAAERVAAMTAITPALQSKAHSASPRAGQTDTNHPAGAVGAERGNPQLGEERTTGSLPVADRVQIGCYGPKQRVGPCTSNYFVASRFRATLYGIAAMRQTFEDVIYDFDEEFPGPGFKGWNVYNMTWAEHFDKSFDRPGYPPHGFMYAKDGFTKGSKCWSCICSTEEMIYNKMYRRNRQLFLPDRNCELTQPYEEVSMGANAAGSLGVANLGDAEPTPTLEEAETRRVGVFKAEVGGDGGVRARLESHAVATEETKTRVRDDLKPGAFGYAELVTDGGSGESQRRDRAEGEGTPARGSMEGR